MKIKVTKGLTLLELLQKFDSGEVPKGEYKTGYGNWVSFDVNRKIKFSQNNFINHRLSDVYEVELEEEVTEDTVFEYLFLVYKYSGNNDFITIYVVDTNIKEIIKGELIFNGNIKHIYTMNPDGTIGQLIWSNGEMIR